MSPGIVNIPPARWIFVALFALSGFTGLIYESIWTHYLKLFLGHAAYAQSLVLAIFMGGMAIGAWWVSRATRRWANLIRCYAVVEAIIGLAALLFHDVFDWFLQGSLTTVIPALHSPLPIEIYRWTAAALLILPQTILLGMSFPLMAGGILRRFPAESGKALALLYFSNSLGAALGALASGFWLIAWIGLPGTIRLAGIINIVIAITVAWLARGREPTPRVAAVAKEPARAFATRVLIIGAFATGAASFVYEIAWIRMLSMVLGTSFHSFELMLSAFITGLALGGLWIRKRIDHISSPTAFLGYVQLAMAVLALTTLLLYNHTYVWMEWLLERLGRTDVDYTMFNLFSHAIAFCIMLPATFCAGMTLPLFTHVLLRRGHGEQAIGQVYAANTLGSICGVLFAVHIGLPMLGLKLSMVVGALIDLILGIALLRLHRPGFVPLHTLAVMTSLLLIVGLVQVAHLDPQQMARGVFLRRENMLSPKDFDLAYYRDGKTATITLYHSKDKAFGVIATNGKPEAGLALLPPPHRKPSRDELTMMLAAAIPLSLYPEARTVANIGFGSGLTTHTLLSHPGLEQVHTIEIEPAMVDAATHFMVRVYQAYQDPRSHIHIEDAKIWFAKTQQQFDIIISEPSNPWVSGVGNLFSEQFYQHIRHYLSENGLLVQWLQLYEFNDRLVAQVLTALDKHFEDYAIFNASITDILIVAPKNGDIPELSADLFAYTQLRQELRIVGIHGPQDLEIRRVGRGQRLRPLFARHGTQANSDYYPTLELEAPRSRFKGETAHTLLTLHKIALPIMEMLDAPALWWREHPVQANDDEPRLGAVARARRWRAAVLDADLQQLSDADRTNYPWMPELIRQIEDCDWHSDITKDLTALAFLTLPHLTREELQDLWVEPGWTCALSEPRMAMFRAVALRSAPDMLRLGLAVLNATEEADLHWHQYAFAAALTGARALGEEALATELQQEHLDRLYPDGEFDSEALLLLLPSNSNTNSL